jgi:hypothetical protein
MIAIRDFVAKTGVASTQSASALDFSGQYKSLTQFGRFKRRGHGAEHRLHAPIKGEFTNGARLRYPHLL